MQSAPVSVHRGAARPPRRRSLSAAGNTDLGFQIAPMIDVVFVILVFFMALAAQIRIEHLLQTRLPGIAVASRPTEFLDEQIIQIDETGQVSLNEELFDAAADSRLPRLTSTLVRLKAASDAAKTKVMVTLLSHPDAAYARMIDVLNALAVAQITQVTFAVEDDPEASP